VKHKTSELTGEALNQAVANANAEQSGVVSYADYCGMWEYGGPIIERERISLQFYGTHWGAVPKDAAGCEVPDLDEGKHRQMADGWCPVMATGDSPLVAAMRAFVLAKMGDEVDL
jgi:hypothetical protein